MFLFSPTFTQSTTACPSGKTANRRIVEKIGISPDLQLAPLRRGFSFADSRLYLPAMPFPTMPDPIADREREATRWHPERGTLELAAAGAVQVLGPDHGVTKALARAAQTMDKADLWLARLAVKMLRRDQREPIAEAGEG